MIHPRPSRAMIGPPPIALYKVQDHPHSKTKNRIHCSTLKVKIIIVYCRFHTATTVEQIATVVQVHSRLLHLLFT